MATLTGMTPRDYAIGWTIAEAHTLTCSSTSNDPWRAWIVDTTSNTVTINDVVWRIWTDGAVHYARQVIAPAPPVRREPTPAELETRRLDEERRRKLDAEARAAQRAIDARAERLLQSALTPTQRACLAERGFFYCTGADGHLYRIRRGTHGNVERVDPTSPDRVLDKFCAQPDYVPTADSMLAQKLAIECNPEAFFGCANRTRVAA